MLETPFHVHQVDQVVAIALTGGLLVPVGGGATKGGAPPTIMREDSSSQLNIKCAQSVTPASLWRQSTSMCLRTTPQRTAPQSK
jgi:hypothetical protein